MRRPPLTLLIVAPILLAIAWAGQSEWSEYRDARHVVSDLANQAAQNESQLIAVRLMQQFQQLSFVANDLIGPRLPARFDAQKTRILKRFAALHPELFGLNVQSADGNRIVWSTRAQPSRPISLGAHFTPLAGSPDFLLGPNRFAHRVGTHVITMRYCMRDGQGKIQYFDGSPYRIGRLLANDMHSPFALVERDLRDGSVLGVWRDSGVTFPKQPPAAKLRLPVLGMPLVVEAAWPRSLVWQQYRHGLAWRLATRLAIILLIGLAATVILRLLRRSQRLAELSVQVAGNETAARTFSDGLFDTIGAIVLVIDARGNILRMNHAAERFTGHKTPEVANQPYFWERFIPEEERPAVHDIFEAMRDHTIPREAKNHWVTRSGERRLFHWINTVMDDDHGQAAYLITVGTDITEQTRLARQNAQLAAYNSFLGQVNFTIAQAQEETGLLQTICESAVRFAGVRLAWIGRPGEDERFEFLAKAGPAEGYLDGIVISIDPDIPEGRGSAGRAWRDDTPYFNTGFENNASLNPWRARAAEHGIKASASLPIHRNGKVWAELVLYAGEDGVFDEALQEVLVELTTDISHGLELLELRHWNSALLEHSDAGIALVRNRSFVSVNTRLARMLGFPDAQSLKGLPTRRFYADEGSYALVGEQYATLAQDGVVRLQALEFVRLDGTPMPADVIGTRLDDENSIWTFLDVSEREQQKKRRLEIEQLYRALMNEGDVLLQTQNEHQMLTATCERLIQGSSFTAVYVRRPDDEGMFVTLASAGSGSQMFEQLPAHVDHPISAVARTWRENSTTIYNDNLAEHQDTVWLAPMTQFHWASVLTTPVRRAGAIWAVLVFASPAIGTFNEQTIELCERIADLLGHGLDELDRKTALQTLRAEEAHRARHDALTGLPNRFALDQYLPAAIARARRHGTWLAVGMLDLDDFKPVNDRFGHEAGDALLRQFAHRMSERSRETDFLARLGGDEFVVVLEELDELQVILQTRQVLARLHQAVETPFKLSDTHHAEVGMSLGLAFYPGDGHEPDALLRQADAAMYQAKTHKTNRAHWWRMGTTQTEVETEAPFDPFGPDSRLLLEQLQTELEPIATDFADAFYDILAEREQSSTILSGLSEKEFAALEKLQADHFRFLLHPDTTELAIARAAERSGAAHALMGIGGAWMTQAMQTYQELLRAHLEQMPTTARIRYRLLRAASARLQLDIGTQLSAMQTVTDAYNTHLARPLGTTDNWNDQAKEELDALASLPGIRSCLLLRPQSDGVFVVEFGAGHIAREMVRILKQPDTRPYLDTRKGTGHGLVPEASRSGQIQRADAYAEDPRTQAWHEALRPLGVRSMVAIPVQVESEPAFVLALQGAYPHQFSSHWMQTFIASLQSRWAQLARTVQAQNPPIDESRAAHYRELLYSGGLRMVVQPVVDLRTGAMIKAEALARLITPQGETVMPAQFLPALGRVDLDALFRSGLQQGLYWLHRWREDGLEIGLSLNLAPSTLLHPDCASWVEEALRESRVAPQHLTLELLETQAFDEAQRSEAIDRLVRLGVQMAIDDLGSGYSSLNRLASLPFDIIKIDQGIIRDIARDPVKALSLVHSVVQIGRDFDREVIVEGVETPALIEAMTLLGARYGQGYGIARPMAAEELATWARQRGWQPASAERITTHLGALAFHWMFMHRNHLRHTKKLANCPFTEFLHLQGLKGSDVERWHVQIHEARDETATKEASAQLVNWLTERVQSATQQEDSMAPSDASDTARPRQDAL